MLRPLLSALAQRGAFGCGLAAGFFSAMIMVIGTTACIAALQLLAAFLG